MWWLTCILLPLYAFNEFLASDELFDSLYELGCERMTICLGTEAMCAGALWRGQWVLARSSCVSAKIPGNQGMSVLRTEAGNCGRRDAEVDEFIVDAVRTMYPRTGDSAHPKPRAELALLTLREPTSRRVLEAGVLALVEKYHPWMKGVMEQCYPTHVEMAPSRPSKPHFTPHEMFFTTVILPSAALILYFLFFTLVTRSKNFPNKNFSEKKAPCVV